MGTTAIIAAIDKELARLQARRTTIIKNKKAAHSRKAAGSTKTGTKRR